MLGQQNPGSQNERLMTLEEAAVAAGVSVRTLARYRKSGALEVVHVGRRVLCTLESIERALVRRSVQQLGREAIAPTQDDEPLGSWLRVLQELAEANPSFEMPARHRAYVEEALRRHGAMRARDYLVSHHRAVHDAVRAGGGGGELAILILSFPDSMPVIEAVRRLHQRFGW